MSRGCRPREYYTVNGEKLLYGFRCKHHPSNTFKTEEELRTAVKKHRKETKKVKDDQ